MAAIDVEAVALGIDQKVIECERVDPGGEQREVSAVQYGEVAQQDIAAVLQRDRLVADSCLLGDEIDITRTVRCRAVGKTLAVDQSGARDGEVAQVLPVEEGIGPMIVAVILVVLPRLGRAGGVVGASVVASGFARLGRGSSEDGASAGEVEVNLRFQANCKQT